MDSYNVGSTQVGRKWVSEIGTLASNRNRTKCVYQPVQRIPSDDNSREVSVSRGAL